jgi:hypothetical protein
MFTVCYSAKGGQGCTTVTAALAVLEPDAIVIDIGGDVPTVLGFPEPYGLGICDLLADTQPIDLATLDKRLCCVVGLDRGTDPEAESLSHLIAVRSTWNADAIRCWGSASVPSS